MKKENKDIAYIVGVVIIILIGLAIRLSGIDKANGLWYDEILTYSLAKESFPFGIIEAVTKAEFQGVLHYLYLGLWMIFFGESDLSLRLSSLVLGIALIPAMYFLGKEVHSKGLGLFTALLISLNPLLAYYSQEVRPYSILALLGVLSTLFLFKIIKKPNNDAFSSDKTISDVKQQQRFQCLHKKGDDYHQKPNLPNYALFALSNVLILYTYTIGFIFVFTQAIAAILYLKFIDKKPLKSFIISQTAICLLYLPYIISIINNFSFYNTTFINTFFYSRVNSFSLIITLQDWFTPLMSGIYLHDKARYEEIFFSGEAGSFVVFLFIILIIGIFLFGLFRSLNRSTLKNYLIFFPCFVFLLAIVIADLSGKFCLVTRHTLLVFPLILFLCCLGLYTLKNKKILIFFMTIILAFYICNFTTESSVTKWERGGVKQAVKFLSEYNLGKDDMVIAPSQSEFIKRYFPEAKTLEINYLDMAFLDKSKNSLKKVISDQNLIDKTNKDNVHTMLKDYLMSKNTPLPLKNLINKSFSELENGRYLVIIRKTDYAPYDEEELSEILLDEEKYNKTTMFRMFASKIVNDMTIECNNNLNPIKKEDVKPLWQVYVYQKAL